MVRSVLSIRNCLFGIGRMQLQLVNKHKQLALRQFSTSPLVKGEDKAHHGNHHHEEGPERHNVLSTGFYKGLAVFWGCVIGFVLQDRYFTRPDENGNPRLHPITRWILYYRESEDERIERIRQMLIETRREAEVNVFHNMETRRPVKNPNYDPRILNQKHWAYEDRAQDTDYVDLSDIKWRKGYGEDEDSIEALKEKDLSAATP